MKHAVRAIVIKDNNLLVMKRNKFGSEYYTLIGGAVEMGEPLEVALHREVTEESSMTISQPRLVFVEDAGQPYGEQYVYLCEYVKGEPTLHPNSEEAKISAMGQNTYVPMWLPLVDLPKVNFVSGSLKEALLHGWQQGFPDQPIKIEWR
jgi:NAD+ diphosphatase